MTVMNIEQLTNLIIENEDVPGPEVVTVVPTVRTNAEFPPPAKFGRPKQGKNTEPPVK